MQYPSPQCMASTQYVHLIEFISSRANFTFKKFNVFTQEIQISHFRLQATCLARNDIQAWLIKLKVGNDLVDQHGNNHKSRNPFQEYVKCGHDLILKRFYAISLSSAPLEPNN